MTVTGARVVVTAGEARPYKVVLEHERTNDTEHPVSTVRVGELLIQSKRPQVAAGAFDFGGPGRALRIGGLKPTWGRGMHRLGRRSVQKIA